MSQQNSAERSLGLHVWMAQRVGNSLEPRLHDVVFVTEVNEVPMEIVTIAEAEQRHGVAVESALLNRPQLSGFVGVNRRDQMDPLGLIERRGPFVWRVVYAIRCLRVRPGVRVD